MPTWLKRPASANVEADASTQRLESSCKGESGRVDEEGESGVGTGEEVMVGPFDKVEGSPNTTGAVTVDEEDVSMAREKRAEDDCDDEDAVEKAGKEFEKSVSSSNIDDKCIKGEGSWIKGDEGPLRSNEFVGDEGTVTLMWPFPTLP